MTTSLTATLNLHKQNFITLMKSINYCNEALCSKNLENWERKEFQDVKKSTYLEAAKLLKLINNPIFK